jgi:hypothetical protein
MHSHTPWSPDTTTPVDPESERTQGDRPYLEVLAELHRALAPKFYLEIGVRRGRSLRLAQCPAVGVDPAPEITLSLPADARVLTQTSDDFFATLPRHPLPQAPDMAFIDGMHWFEFALRDFINIERLATATTLIVIDDVFPVHPAQAERERRTRVWTGDIWKLHRCLSELRPDLLLLALDTSPTGLLLVAGLDSDNRVLSDRYDALVERAGHDQPAPPSVLRREGARSTRDPAAQRLTAALRACREAGTTRIETVAALRAAIAETQTGI